MAGAAAPSSSTVAVHRSPGQEWSLDVNCNEVLEQLGDYLDEDARAELCREIEDHLHQCHDCQVYVDTVKKTIMLYQSDRSVQIPVNVGSKLAALMAREYRDGSGGSGTG